MKKHEINKKNKLLLIDDDDSFSQYVLKTAESLKIPIEVAQTLDEGRKLIKSEDFFGFLVDGYLPDGEGLELIRELREKDNTKPIALISIGYSDSESFKKIKEQFSIDYIIQKPIDEKDLKHLLELIIHEDFEKKKNLASFDYLYSLRIEYSKKIPDKIMAFEGVIKKLEREINEINLTNLKVILHKTAGSAGSYGYMDVTKLCRDMEKSIEEKIDNLKKEHIDNEWIKEFWRFFRRLKVAFQSSSYQKELQGKKSEVYSEQEEISVQALMIDDDRDFCEFVLDSLAPIGIKISHYQSGENLLKNIEVDQATLVFLNIDLPQVNGIELLKLIREDFRFRTLPVVIISSRGDSECMKKAYELGIEDFIQKPVDKKMLQIRIKNCLRKLKDMEGYKDIDSKTGVYHKSVLLNLFQLIVAQHPHASIVLIQITAVDVEIKEKAIDKLIHLFTSFFRDQDLMGKWNENQFLLIFPNHTIEQSRGLLEKVFEELQKDSVFQEHSDLYLNAGVVGFPDYGTNLKSLANHSEDQLNFAIREGHWKISAAEERKVERSRGLKGKKALIIEDDDDIIQIVKTIYESKGMELTSFNDGESALEWFEKNLFDATPDLIIIDWMLPGISGIEVLDKVKHITGDTIPIIILSTLCQEKNILEGLQKGADEYIAKPFSIQVFLEKTNNLIGI